MHPIKIIILIDSFFDFNKKSIKIGGVQTYIKDLALLSKSLGFETLVVQYSKETNKCQKETFNEICIFSVPLKSSAQNVYNTIRKENPEAYIINASDQYTIRDNNRKTLQIQHGVAFDIPRNYIQGIWGRSRILSYINKLLRCIKNVRRFYQVPNTVCVDYNYFNWFRTLGTISSNNFFRVVPNYSSKIISYEGLTYKLTAFNGVKKILFARRFVDYRGTLLFANVADMILNKYPEINITFAGSGPLENRLRERFGNNSRVTITSFDSDMSIAFHSKYDIAVIPTIFSEGTSLSLLEAMAAGCLSISTYVGGMTNILIDGFNGFMTYPSTIDVYNTIVRCIEMPIKEYRVIVEESYKTIKRGFSMEKWEKRWTNVLYDWINNQND